MTTRNRADWCLNSSPHKPHFPNRMTGDNIPCPGEPEHVRRAMGSHQSARAETTTWLTPREITDELGPFDLDPCAAPSPRPWSTAERHIELPEDGLAAEWSGYVWCNPPYSFAAWDWLDKLADHGNGIALVFARTETAGFVRTVWNRASAVLFIHGRLHFHYPDGSRAQANSGAPSALVAYGDRAALRLCMSNIEGTYVPLRNTKYSRDIPLEPWELELEAAGQERRSLETP